MAITSVSKYSLGDGVWRVTAVSDESAPMYYWWANGIFLTATRRAWYDYVIPLDERWRLEVFDDAADVPEHVVLPSKLVLRWERSGNAVRYRIDHYEDGEWNEDFAPPVAETGKWMYRYSITGLDSGEEHRFRVVSIADDGDEVEMEFYVWYIANPLPVEATVSVDEVTGKMVFV